MVNMDSKSLFKLYGIKNCDAIKKARRWLEEQGVAYQFHDYRADRLTEQQLHDFVERAGWQPLLNIRGTIWRKLDEAQRNTCDNADAAIALLGFSADSYQQFISEATS